MNIDHLKKGMSAQSSEIRFLRLALLIVLLICVLSSWVALTADKSMKLEVMAPPTVVKDFWVSNKYFDDSYLEQMGMMMGYMLLNATPASLSYQMKMIKPYLAPGLFAKKEVEVETQRKKFEKYQITTSFVPTRVYVPKRKDICRVEIEGTLHKMIGTKSLQPKQGKLTLDCENINGRFYVTNITDNF